VTRDRNRKPQIALPALLLAFLGVGIVAGARDRGPVPVDTTARVVAAVRPIALNVESIRHLRFRRLPRPEVVTPAETRRTTLSQLDRDYPPAKRRNDAELLELLGLLPPGTDLASVVGDVSSDQVAGFYDPKRKRLAVVKGPAAASGALAEITLAHELTHALEDQRFKIRDEPSEGADDGGTAYTALVEGTATSVMNDYAQRYIPASAALVSAFTALGPSQQAAAKIPPYIQRSLEFSYTGGASFVDTLRRRGHGWRLVNLALSKRPPVSSEQIIHPEKWMPFEPALPVRIPDPGLGSEWKRASRGTIGELDTRELLRLGVDSRVASQAAAGWGGGRYELWRDAGAAAGCDAPCRQAGVVVVRWRWDSARDAREFDAALPEYVVRGLHGSPAGPARWRVGDGGAAVTAGGDSATLVLAPSPALAARVAGSAGS
jgi:hypothetical protein